MVWRATRSRRTAAIWLSERADRPAAYQAAPRRRGEIDQLLVQPRGTSPAALRDRALLELLSACGIRASEAIALEQGDLDLDTGVLRVDANGPRERPVSVPRSALAAIRAYLHGGRPLLVGPREQQRMFVNWRGATLTRQGIYKIVERHARTAGLADAGARRHCHHPAVHGPGQRRLTGGRSDSSATLTAPTGAG